MSQTPLAVVILVHADPDHLARLVGALDEMPIFVHCDATTSAQTFARMVELLPARVTFVERIPTSLASWSLVAAELAALRAALRQSDARHIAVLSGSDYPLLSVDDLYRELEAWDGHSWVPNSPLPFKPWGSPRHDDGGMWRLEHRFFTRRDNVLFVGDYPLRWPRRRKVPVEVRPRAATQWKIYARDHAQRLLEVLDDRPDLVGFWRRTLVPDESAIASLMASPELFGSDRLPVQPTEAWYLDWNSDNAGHPRWLDDADFEKIKSARWAPSFTPEDPMYGELVHLTRRKLFARKMSSTKSALLVDRIDAELRNVSS